MNTPPLKRIRLSKTQLLRLLTPIVSFVPIANAADVFKANNADATNITTSWTGGVLPTATDVAVFDGSITSIVPDAGTGLSYIPFAVAASWQGIRVSHAINGLALDSFGLGAPVLTLGSAGIDLSSADPGAKFQMYGQSITLGAFQSWNVADGAILEFGGTTGVTRAAGTPLKLVLGATGTGVISLTNTTIFGAPNAVLGYMTVGGGDFGAVNATQTALVAGATLGTYQPNPNTGDVAPTIGAAATGVQDIINSNTIASATAVRIGANMAVTGFRFNTAHATGLDWTVDGSSTTRNINIGGGGIVVGPNVGAHNVSFNGASQFRFGANSDFYIHQFNTAGDLILNNAMNQSGTGTRLNKDGPGRLILANSFNSLSGQTTIHEGTIQVGNGGASGSINSGGIANFGTLAFNRSDSFTLANAISGTGPVQKFGAGTLTLSGANTFTGSIAVNAGAIAFSSLANLGAGTSISLAGGGLVWGTGNTADLSARAITFGVGGATFDSNGNNLVFANPIGNSGPGGLTKAGVGNLTLAAANLYGGNTVVTGGGLILTNTSGSATGSGNVTIANGTTLSGTGAVTGAVTIAAGAKLTPGVAGIGTLTTGGLSLAAGSLLDLEFGSVSSHDKVVVNNLDGLAISGGGILAYNIGTTTSLATEGAYNLFQYNGGVGGTGETSLSVLNPAPGFVYNFSKASGFVTMTVVRDSVPADWIATGSGSWGAGSNWSDVIAAGGSAAYTAQFMATLGSPVTVTLDGNRTTGGVVFESNTVYSIAAGSGGSLILDRGTNMAGLSVNLGNHVISAPVVVNSTVGVSTVVGSGVTISGAVSGTGGIVKSGPGTLDLTGTNSFSGPVSVVGGVLGFANASSLGSAALTINGGTLRYDAGNTSDISSKVFTFALNGTTVDTNGNNVTFANPVGNGGLGAFTKSGLGSLTLAGANTYLGQTFVTGGALLISSNANLGPGATASPLNLDGGAVLTPLASFTLDNAGANARSIAVGAAGAAFSVGQGIVFTVPGAVSGTGSLAKSGSGELVLTGANSSLTGPINFTAGTIKLGSTAAIGQTGLGSGLITFGDGTNLYLNGQGAADNGTSFGGMANAFDVPTGVTAGVWAPQRGGYSGVVTGAGTLNLHVDGQRFDVLGNWPAFTGTFNVIKTPTGAGTDVDDYILNGAQNLIGAKVNLGAGVRVLQNFNPPANTTGTIHSFGELNVDATSILGGNTVSGRYNVYSVGALNTDSTISGQITGSLLGSFGFGYPILTKVGSGTLTLNGSHMMTAGTGVNSVNVNAGTLKLMGSIERFYTGIGADGEYGRHSVSLLCDDTISLTPPATAYVDTIPSAMSVVAGATLAGNGSFGGAATINGTLRPDATGSLGGKLAFTNTGTLTLTGSALTQFDFSSVTFTGIRSEAPNGVTYGGALKLNFLNTVYNGSYTLFQLNGSPGGAFAGVTVTTTTDADVALVDNLAGAWTGTVSGITYTFTPATGVLDVSGGATVVLPSVPAGVTATGGNAQVTLGWNASANTTNYLVKRSIVSGGPYTTLTSAVVTTSYVDTTVTNDSTYFYVIEAQNAVGVSGNSAQVSATPVAHINTGFENWRLANFGSIANTGNGADGADPDGDGFVNLLEYATNRNPNVADTAPLTSIGRTGDGLRLTLTYTSVADANLVYTVQGVNDIAGTPAWSTVATSTGAGNVAGSTTVTDTQLISASPRRFLRLSVSYTAP